MALRVRIPLRSSPFLEVLAMWSIQILWAGTWVTVQEGFQSRNDAEWAAAKWKAENDCTGDPFRAYQVK